MLLQAHWVLGADWMWHPLSSSVAAKLSPQLRAVPCGDSHLLIGGNFADIGDADSQRQWLRHRQWHRRHSICRSALQVNTSEVGLQPCLRGLSNQPLLQVDLMLQPIPCNAHHKLCHAGVSGRVQLPNQLLELSDGQRAQVRAHLREQLAKLPLLLLPCPRQSHGPELLDLCLRQGSPQA